MDDPNITMEEYIRLEEEKAQKRGKVFNWKLLTIAFNDEVSSEKTLSGVPTVSSLDDETDFRISFDNSDDEDYTVIFDKNSFSYKIVSTNDLKMYSENDNKKVNMPSLRSPEPTVSCFDDLDFFKDFENEFPAIVYNNAQTSKSDLLTEPILSPQHIDEFDLNDETSLSEYDKEEQNVLTMPKRLGRLKEEVQALRQDVRTLRGLVERSVTDQGRFSTWMISCMAQLMEASGQTYQAFNGTF
ncbi:hypothetical protein Tco_0846228 [Tanacetum coccineum]